MLLSVSLFIFFASAYEGWPVLSVEAIYRLFSVYSLQLELALRRRRSSRNFKTLSTTTLPTATLSTTTIGHYTTKQYSADHYTFDHYYWPLHYQTILC